MPLPDPAQPDRDTRPDPLAQPEPLVPPAPLPGPGTDALSAPASSTADVTAAPAPPAPALPGTPAPPAPVGPFPELFAANTAPGEPPPSRARLTYLYADAAPPPPAWSYTPMGRLRMRYRAIPRGLRVTGGIVLGLALLLGLCNFSWSLRPEFEATSAFSGEYASWAKAEEFPMPKVEATENFDAESVEDALNEVRDLLILTRIEWPQGKQDRAALVRAFAPQARDGVNEDLDSGSGRITYATELAPKTALAEGTRVEGVVSFMERTDEYDDGSGDTYRALEVHVNLTWAYSIADDRHNRLVTLHAEGDYQFPLAEDVGEELTGMWLTDANWETSSNVDCQYLYEGLIGLNGTHSGNPRPPKTRGTDPSAEAEDYIEGC